MLMMFICWVEAWTLWRRKQMLYKSQTYRLVQKQLLRKLSTWSCLEIGMQEKSQHKDDNKSSERVEYFKCMGTAPTYQNSIHEKMKSRLCQGLLANIRWRIFGLPVCYPKKYSDRYFFFIARQSLVSQGLLIIKASRSYSDTSHSVVVLWTSDHPATEISTW
jgi:hypothetical protein